MFLKKLSSQLLTIVVTSPELESSVMAGSGQGQQRKETGAEVGLREMAGTAWDGVQMAWFGPKPPCVNSGLGPRSHPRPPRPHALIGCALRWRVHASPLQKCCNKFGACENPQDPALDPGFPFDSSNLLDKRSILLPRPVLDAVLATKH